MSAKSAEGAWPNILAQNAKRSHAVWAALKGIRKMMSVMERLKQLSKQTKGK